MTGLELIKEYPKAGEIILQWYKDKMQASLTDVEGITEDLKESFKQYTVGDAHMGLMIDSTPRMLFDVFDDNSIFIVIHKEKVFSYDINNGEVIAGAWNNRKETEMAAIRQAFILLDKK